MLNYAEELKGELRLLDCYLEEPRGEVSLPPAFRWNVRTHTKPASVRHPALDYGAALSMSHLLRRMNVKIGKQMRKAFTATASEWAVFQ